MWQPGSGGISESRGELTASSFGTLVTAAGSADTKGSWVNLGAVTSFAYEAITLAVARNSGTDSYMIDIGISDGSNRYVVIADLEFSAEKLTSEHAMFVSVPVHIPSGAQLSARLAAATLSVTADVSLVGHSSGLGGAPGFSRCIALFTPALSRGIAIDPGGTANTKGSWTQMTASCPEDIGAMFGLIGFNADVARIATTSMLLDIGLGAAASEYVLYPNAGVCWGTTRDGPSNCPRLPVFACDVPKTTRIAARAACSDNTAGDRTVDLALYGLVK